MFEKYEGRIDELMALGVRDFLQTGGVTVRHLTVNLDGSEFMFPPVENHGISLNLGSHSARLNFKVLNNMKVTEGQTSGFLLLHDKLFVDPVKQDGNGILSLHVLCIDSEGQLFVTDRYSFNDAGDPNFIDRQIMDADPEQPHWKHGTLAELILSVPDEDFAKVPQELWADGLPQEWVDYVLHERQNRDSDEWESAPGQSFEAALFSGVIGRGGE